MLRAAALLLLACALAAPAFAQQVTLEPSALVRCMRPAGAERGLPEYPFEAWREGRAAYLKIELSFAGPDVAPDMKVLQDTVDPSFAAAVREHVKRLRVPCMRPEDAPARLTQEYVFQPVDRFVRYGETADPADLEREILTRCITHRSGSMMPPYPTEARRREIRGNVLASMRFTRPDIPPEVKVFARPGARPLARAIESWADGYRMPCLVGAPIETTFTFVYRFEDDRAYGFKPLTLQQLLPIVRNILLQRLDFDTARMGCPFDLRFTYRQPHLPNTVHEVGERSVTRRELIEWLRESELDLPGEYLDSVFGDSTVITVPCLKIDLKPKE